MIKIIFSTDKYLSLPPFGTVGLLSMSIDTMKDTILCVIDFSDSARKTLQWAISSAFKSRAHLTILYPYRLKKIQNGESVIEMRKKIEQEAQLRFKKLENDLLPDGQISYEFKSEVGFLADRVEEHSKHHRVNFLVVNRELRTSHRESFDDLVENTRIPVVIIP